MDYERILHEYRLVLQPLDPQGEPKGSTREAGRSKLGGLPDWIQGDETPECPRCTRTMTFIAQVDSFDAGLGNPAPTAGEFSFGDAGMLYLFHCFRCGETVALSQCE